MLSASGAAAGFRVERERPRPATRRGANGSEQQRRGFRLRPFSNRYRWNGFRISSPLSAASRPRLQTRIVSRRVTMLQKLP